MKKINKIFVLCAMVSISIVIAISATSAQIQSPTQLIVNYESTHLIEQINSGGSGTLIIVIQNSGGLPAKDVEVYVQDTGAIKGGGSWKLGTIDAGQTRTIKTTLRAAPDAYSGTHTINLFLDYNAYERDESGGLDSHTESTNWVIPIRVYGDPNFQITADRSVFYNSVEENLGLKGSVMTNVKKVSVSLITPPTNCVSTIGSEKQYIGNLNKDQEFAINYTIKPVKVGVCTLSILFEYEDASGNTLTETVSLGIELERSGIDFKIVGVEYPSLNPGGTVEIIVDIQNVGNTYAEDVSVDLGLEMEDISMASPELAVQFASEYPFVMIRVSETYFDRFDAGEIKKAKFKMSIEDTADAKPYEIPLKIKYYDGAGVEYKIMKSIGLEVKGDIDLVARVDKSDISSSKRVGDVSISIINKGSADVKFLSVKLLDSDDNYEILSKDEAYVGEIESDDYDTVTYNIRVKEDGDSVPLYLVIEYKDNYDELYTEEMNVELKLTDSGAGNGIGIYTIAILVLLAIVVYLVYGRFVKRKVNE